MNKHNLLVRFLVVIFALFSNFSMAQVGRLKTTLYGHTLVGYQTDWWGLSFGNQSPQYGSWNIQYYDQGLNFWKPSGSVSPGDYKLHIHDQGYVGINGKANAVLGQLGFRLQVFGYSVSNGWYVFSDSSLKENILPINSALPYLLKINPIEYNYKTIKLSGDSILPTMEDKVKNSNIFEKDTKKHYGLTAQEVSKTFPYLVDKFDNNVGVVDYVGFIPLLIKGLQEQQVVIEELKLKVAELEKQK